METNNQLVMIRKFVLS